ncbi:hypothetical protein SAMN06265827_12816 [Orenia metallireducens]|uniref:Uncharacterized protein n=1 Tax=Orenia metallireducens TaxID=1413210 RepID=A0A285I2K2_9FIRM|nr:hypothetical protein [Orenia metallireducens]SNY41191.1 hypothetical protein SAMN06265827_12816 [Orenia metallireducens]
MKKLINKVALELQEEFSQNPYDFTSCELEAQIKVYESLNEIVIYADPKISSEYKCTCEESSEYNSLMTNKDFCNKWILEKD